MSSPPYFSYPEASSKNQGRLCNHTSMCVQDKDRASQRLYLRSTQGRRRPPRRRPQDLCVLDRQLALNNALRASAGDQHLKKPYHYIVATGRKFMNTIYQVDFEQGRHQCRTLVPAFVSAATFLALLVGIVQRLQYKLDISYASSSWLTLLEQAGDSSTLKLRGCKDASSDISGA